jgi:hypothetical protein
MTWSKLHSMLMPRLLAEYSWQAYKEAIPQCVRLGKNPTHSKRPIKAEFKPGDEGWTDWGKPDTVPGQQDLV